jgi:NADP-dependent 3-hydroxy acid dehydrogenase YdfG
LIGKGGLLITGGSSEWGDLLERFLQQKGFTVFLALVEIRTYSRFSFPLVALDVRDANSIRAAAKVIETSEDWML